MPGERKRLCTQFTRLLYSLSSFLLLLEPPDEGGFFLLKCFLVTVPSLRVLGTTFIQIPGMCVEHMHGNKLFANFNLLLSLCGRISSLNLCSWWLA